MFAVKQVLKMNVTWTSGPHVNSSRERHSNHTRDKQSELNCTKLSQANRASGLVALEGYLHELRGHRPRKTALLLKWLPSLSLLLRICVGRLQVKRGMPFVWVRTETCTNLIRNYTGCCQLCYRVLAARAMIILASSLFFPCCSSLVHQ